MPKFLKNILLWLYLKYHNIATTIAIALYNTEVEILKADPNDLQEKDKRIQRNLHRNQTLEKFYAGQIDEKYIRGYYDVLKKSDKFLKTANEHQLAVAADKYAKNYAQADEWGKKFEHFGFFDDKHKHFGKSLEEILALEKEERRTKDDEYELLLIYDNKPIEGSVDKLQEAIEKGKEQNLEFEMISLKSLHFPVKIVRKNEKAVNKIEELAETLHIKKIGFEYRLLEFHIPIFFKTLAISENSIIFAELIDIDEVYIKDRYGELTGFKINKFVKRIIHNNVYDVFKFEAIEMQTIER